MKLGPIAYERIPAEADSGHCYMCFPPHEAEYWSAGGTHVLQLCEKVFDRLVKEGKAVRHESDGSTLPRMRQS